MTTLVPEEQHLPLTLINTHLSVILRIFNSDERIEIEKFTTLCRDTYELIIVSFPWSSITPTLHKILAHSAQLIDDIMVVGMKYCSEEDLEACHKYIRRYREQLARKTSFKDNTKDVYIRHLAQSDDFSSTQRKLICTKRIKKSLKQTSQHE